MARVSAFLPGIEEVSGSKRKVLALGFLVAALLALSLLMARPAHAVTLTVNSTADPGTGGCNATECTLREAITASNASSTIDDTINFNIPGTSVHTISLTSALPTIVDEVTIDGYTQPGASENTSPENTNNAVLKVELNGANAGASADGLTISGADAAGTTIKGLVINRFGDDGVLVNALNTTIEGNFIGTNAAGDADLDNGSDGVTVLSSGNVIGGLANGAQNVISGNGENGVKILDAGATGNTISNNHIGTDADAGEDLGNSQSGVLVADAPDNTIGGSSADGTLNIISGNDQHGVEILGIDADGAKVLGNLIGLDRNGVSSSNIGNTLNGVHVSTTSQVEIGGTAAGQGNTISDNGDNGVEIAGNSNKVLGNRIGTDKNGNSAHGNDDDGVRITDVSDNMIGGADAGARNIISGNDDNGVFISGTSAATNNRIEGNFIGTNVNGSDDVSNGDSGVRVETSGNFIGGTASGAGNVISGNTLAGVLISRADASANRVEGNLIGTDAGGTAPLGNADGGVALFGSDNTIGGTVNETSNRIAFNGGDGVVVIGNPATGNRSLRNSIFSNDGLGIDLTGGTENAAGATANDPRDPDTGPNNLQNKPVITSATTSRTGTVIRGRINSTPRRTFTLQIFSNPRGQNEGKKLIGQRRITTDTNGNAPFSLRLGRGAVGVGQFLTATATNDATGDTSEFSPARAVQR